MALLLFDFIFNTQNQLGVMRCQIPIDKRSGMVGSLLSQVLEEIEKLL